MRVRDRMSRNLFTVTPETPLEEALKRMRENRLRRFPVVDKSGKLVGIISQKDLMYASPTPAASLSIYEMHYLLSKLTVGEVMVKDVITVTEDTLVEQAARIMTEHKIDGLPVMRNDQLVGIITETDLFKLFAELLGSREQGVRMTMLIPEKTGALAQITSRVAELGGNIVALGTFLGENPTNRLVTLKVADVPKDKLVAVLTPLVVEMIDARDA